MQVPLLYGWPNNQLLHVHNVDMSHQQYLVQPAAEHRARPLSPIRDQSRLKEAYARTESVFDRLRRSVPTEPRSVLRFVDTYMSTPWVQRGGEATRAWWCEVLGPLLNVDIEP